MFGENLTRVFDSRERVNCRRELTGPKDDRW